jgi:hypothetical protein
MSSTDTSLSSSFQPSTPARLNDYLGLSHPPHAAKSCIVTPLSIRVDDEPDSTVPGFLHLPPTRSATPSSKTAAVLLLGAGGGIVGSSSIYLSLADKLASLHQPVPTLRLDCRYPARNKYCVRMCWLPWTSWRGLITLINSCLLVGLSGVLRCLRLVGKILGLLVARRLRARLQRRRVFEHWHQDRYYCCMVQAIEH